MVFDYIRRNLAGLLVGGALLGLLGLGTYQSHQAEERETNVRIRDVQLIQYKAGFLHATGHQIFVEGEKRPIFFYGEWDPTVKSGSLVDLTFRRGYSLILGPHIDGRAIDDHQ